MKKFTVLLLLLTCFNLPSFAQEVTPEATQDPEGLVVVGTLPDATEVEQDASNTLTENALFLAFAAPLVFMLTAVFKRAPFLQAVSSAQIGLVLNILIWVAYVVARQYGAGDQFETVTSSATTILGAFLGMSLTSPAAGYLHSQAVKSKTPVLGYTRTTPPL